ncbi:MAG: hypothetical protein E7173_01390 [Firmicutes bacterium]|nr:hypothetical protein [Bacillota bacterium]
MKNFRDIDLVNYIINQEATLKDAAEYFGVSVETIKKRMSKIKKELLTESSILIDLNSVADKNTLEGRRKGGTSTNSGVVRILNLPEIANLARRMLADNLTLSEAANSFKMPSSTLYDNLEALKGTEYDEIYKDLKIMYEVHILAKGSLICYDNTKVNKTDVQRLTAKYSLQLKEDKKEDNHQK